MSTRRSARVAGRTQTEGQSTAEALSHLPLEIDANGNVTAANMDEVNNFYLIPAVKAHNDAVDRMLGADKWVPQTFATECTQTFAEYMAEQAEKVKEREAAEATAASSASSSRRTKKSAESGFASEKTGSSSRKKEKGTNSKKK